MENEEVFETEAEQHGLAKSQSQSSYRSTQEGHDAAKSAQGEIETQEDVDYEDTPLLSHGRGGNTEASPALNDNEGRGRDDPSWPGQYDFEGQPWYRTPSIFWLLPAFALFTMAFGATIVPKVNLMLSLICDEYFASRSMADPNLHTRPVIFGEINDQCRIPEVQTLVSKFTLYGSLISGLLSGITTPKLGELSDRYGRTRTMCMATLGMLISETITIIVATYPDMLSVNWILLGYFFDGLGGSFIAAMALSYSYASDCTAPSHRNVAFSYYHGTLFAGIALGPILGGIVVEATGKILSVFYIAISFHTFFFLFLLLVVPESLTKKRQIAAREKKEPARQDEEGSPSPGKYFVSIVKGNNVFSPLAILWPKEKGTSPAVRKNLFFLAAVDATMFGIAMGSMNIILIYSNYMFGWETLQTSVFMSIVNSCRVAVLLVILPVVTYIVRGPAKKGPQKNTGCDLFDLTIIRLAISFDTLGYIGYAIARTGNLFIACGAVASVGGMGSPTLQSALTKHVPPDRTGQLLGALGLLHAAGRVIAPLIFNLIYASTVGSFSQTVFVCLAATFGVAFTFSWFIKPGVSWESSGPAGKQADDAGETDVEEGSGIVR